ncbi:MAG: DJ-1/PfpI family protein [Vulcanisaeta sp.]|jgi:putative intracellular protease/amidase|uniref:DJ-1/PfpI family protein n=1 Tax=Vulcanisaeta sp. TaxID=2020871 RepID=UPI003D10F1D9
MKALIIVADVSYKGEYSMAVQALRQLGMEVSTGLVSKSVNVNFDIDLTGGLSEGILSNYDAVIYIGGYWAYYASTGKEIPGRIKPMVNKEVFEEILTQSVNGGKTTILPLATPAYAAKLGLLKGKKATVYPTTDLITILRNNGVEYINDNFVIDGSIITLKKVTVESLTKALSK